jgi:DNA-binding SARP family transcriptional activator
VVVAWRIDAGPASRFTVTKEWGSDAVDGSSGAELPGVCVRARAVTAAAPVGSSPGYRSSLQAGRVALTLLDGFELRCGGEPVPLPMSAQRLLAFLALHDRPMRRPHVAGTLWPNAPEERAAANLRSSLWRLNRPGHPLVDMTGHQLRLMPAVGVDARETAAVAHRLLTHSTDWEDIEVGSPGLAGELLPGWYDDWVIIERESLHQLRLRALEALGERLLGVGRLGEALEAAVAAVAGDPLRESAHRLLIQVHLAEGNAAEAIRQFGLFSRQLDEQLGLAPSPRLAALVRDARGR